jgi:hypothetical protein
MKWTELNYECVTQIGGVEIFSLAHLAQSGEELIHHWTSTS